MGWTLDLSGAAAIICSQHVRAVLPQAGVEILGGRLLGRGG